MTYLVKKSHLYALVSLSALQRNVELDMCKGNRESKKIRWKNTECSLGARRKRATILQCQAEPEKGRSRSDRCERRYGKAWWGKKKAIIVSRGQFVGQKSSM